MAARFAALDCGLPCTSPLEFSLGHCYPFLGPNGSLCNFPSATPEHRSLRATLDDHPTSREDDSPLPRPIKVEREILSHTRSPATTRATRRR
jgi:hypothetical protein